MEVDQVDGDGLSRGKNQAVMKPKMLIMRLGKAQGSKMERGLLMLPLPLPARPWPCLYGCVGGPKDLKEVERSSTVLDEIGAGTGSDKR